MLDHLLAVLLLLALPARGLWRSRRRRTYPEPKTSRYIAAIGIVGVLLSLLIADWVITGRSATALGLGAPTSTRAWAGLGTASILIVLALIVRPKSSSGQEGMDQARRELLPESANEVRLFLLLAVAVGFGWEVSYRGFLLFYLQPHIGLAGAVIAAALAYGLAHGFKGRGQFAGSIVAALAFTISYAGTGNLWWLILLHTTLPLLSLLASRFRKSR